MWRYTRSVALHPIRRGVMPTDRVHRLQQQAQPRAFSPDTPKRQHQTQPHNLEIPARLRTRGATPDPSRYTRSVAIHPFRRATPDQKGCNAYGSGAPPHRQQASSRITLPSADHTGIQQDQATQQCTRYSSNALEREHRTAYYPVQCCAN